ncbi:hypothetical protein ID866_12051 [Astraeus odoratus]|nr:hypothetical protein ID866_12051 [Astraeus odoratus]
MMDPATPAGMEQEGNEDPIALNPTPSPPCKKANHVWVRSPSPFILAQGPVPSTSTSISQVPSTSQLMLTGGSAYVLLDTFQQVLVWEWMTQLEQEMAEMTTTMHCWWDNFVTHYLELSECIMAMEENQQRFINQPFMDEIRLLCEDLSTLEQRGMGHDIDIQLEQSTCHVGHMADIIQGLSMQHHNQGTQTGMDKAGPSGIHGGASDI